MDVYILNTNSIIAPFDRPAATLKVHNRTLAENHRDLFHAQGLKVHNVDHVGEINRFPCFLVHDDLYLTHYAFARFAKAVRRNERRGGTAQKVNGWRAALGVSPVTERFAGTFQGDQGLCNGNSIRQYDCYYLKNSSALSAPAERCESLEIPYRMVKMSTRMNRYFEPSGRFLVPISLVYMLPIKHWSCLVTANLMGLAAYTTRCASSRFLSTATLPLKMLWRAGSLKPGYLLGKTYFADRGCRIHPSAHIEGSILGRRVKIGPHAVVRNCVIGDRTVIGPGALVEASSVGRSVIVDGYAAMRGMVVDDEAAVGDFIQFSVIGRRAVTCPGSAIADFSLRGSVQVKMPDGSSVASGSNILGGCLGDEAFLAPGVGLLCGRELPNGCIIAYHPRWLVRDVDKRIPDNVIRLDAAASRSRQRRRSRAA